MAATIAAAVLYAPALSAGVSVEAPYSCDSRSASKHVKLAKGVANAGYSKKRWKRGPTKAQVHRIRDHLGCLDRAKDRKSIKRHVSDRRSAQRLYRKYRGYAPFRCGKGWKSYYAIPCYIISCESRFNWWARNSSGASWIYQLLGWGAPAPVDWPAKVENHRIAHEVSSGSRNFSPWVCA